MVDSLTVCQGQGWVPGLSVSTRHVLRVSSQSVHRCTDEVPVITHRATGRERCFYKAQTKGARGARGLERRSKESAYSGPWEMSGQVGEEQKQLSVCPSEAGHDTLCLQVGSSESPVNTVGSLFAGRG